jgi:hypothetical protein
MPESGYAAEPACRARQQKTGVDGKKATPRRAPAPPAPWEKRVKSGEKKMRAKIARPGPQRHSQVRQRRP